jgi:ketopantoate reductase
MKPSQHHRNAARCIVAGGGALGFLLADGLSQAAECSAFRYDVVVAGRRSLPKVLISLSGSSGPRPSHIPVVLGTPREILEQSQTEGDSAVSIFLCVPPESTEMVFKEWINAAGNQSLKNSVEIVFCNNGILSAPVRKIISEKASKINFLRAVFFVGAVRIEGDGLCRIVHNGGQLVRWGYLPLQHPVSDSGTQESQFQKTSFWMNRSESSGQNSFSTGFLNWKFEENPDRLECEKFFTNFILAAVIGPRAGTNSEIFQKSSDAERTLLAEQFADLWTDAGIQGTSLLENLKETVEATAANINSLSLQGVNGSTSAAEYFFRTVEQKILASGRPERFDELNKFLNSARQSWGLKA